MILKQTVNAISLKIDYNAEGPMKRILQIYGPNGQQVIGLPLDSLLDDMNLRTSLKLRDEREELQNALEMFSQVMIGANAGNYNNTGGILNEMQRRMAERQRAQNDSGDKNQFNFEGLLNSLPNQINNNQINAIIKNTTKNYCKNGTLYKWRDLVVLDFNFMMFKSVWWYFAFLDLTGRTYI